MTRAANRGPAVFSALVGGMLMLASGAALSQDTETRRMARDAYDRGAAAYNSGDYAAAAREMARADALVPNPVALEIALKASMRSDDAPFAMLLVERAEARGSEGTLAQAAARARQAFALRVGKLMVMCPERRTCRASVDGEPTPVGVHRWVTPGDHAVELVVDGHPETRQVRVQPGAEQRVMSMLGPAAPPLSVASTAPTTAPALPSERAESGKGLSPTWVWIGVGTTAMAGALTVVSAFDTKSKHDSFTSSPSFDLQSKGESAALRTNVLIGITAALGIATGSLALWAVDWGKPSSTAASRPPLVVSLGVSSVAVTAHY